MSSFAVVTEQLATAATAVTRTLATLDGAQRAVDGSAGAASGTPAAGAYEALVADAHRDLATLQSAMEDLSHALGRAAQTYQGTEDGVAGYYLRAR